MPVKSHKDAYPGKVVAAHRTMCQILFRIMHIMFDALAQICPALQAGWPLFLDATGMDLELGDIDARWKGWRFNGNQLPAQGAQPTPAGKPPRAAADRTRTAPA